MEFETVSDDSAFSRNPNCYSKTYEKKMLWLTKPRNCLEKKNRSSERASPVDIHDKAFRALGRKYRRTRSSA
jgi:predicted kinase